MKSKEKEYRAKYWHDWRLKNMPYKIKKCSVCGIQFGFKKGEAKRNRCDNCKVLICKECGKKFIPPGGQYGMKFCNNICKNNFAKGTEPEHLKTHRGIKPRTYHLTKRDKHGNAFDRDWRSAVFVRDDYTCQKCKKRGGKIQAHHIKSFKKYPKLRYDLSNGITLCLDCHKKTDTYGWVNYWKKEIAANRMSQEVLDFTKPAEL